MVADFCYTLQYIIAKTKNQTKINAFTHNNTPSPKLAINSEPPYQLQHTQPLPTTITSTNTATVTVTATACGQPTSPPLITTTTIWIACFCYFFIFDKGMLLFLNMKS
jgi:hypothetical protein